jgi:hypothetical protein
MGTEWSRRDREKLNQELDYLCMWAERWGMEINIPKSKMMLMAVTTHSTSL